MGEIALALIFSAADHWVAAVPHRANGQQ